MYVVLIWDTISNVQLFAGLNGFAKVFKSPKEALAAVKKYEGGFNYQVVEIEKGNH